MVELRFRELNECKCGHPISNFKGKPKHLHKSNCRRNWCDQCNCVNPIPVRVLELEGLTTELKQIAEEIADAKAGLLHISHSDLKIDGELNGAERRLRVLAEKIKACDLEEKKQ